MSVCIGRRVDNSCGGDKPTAGTIIVKDEGVPLPNNPFNMLNFTGAGVMAVDGGGGTTNINIPGGAIGSKRATYTLLKDPVSASSIAFSSPGVSVFPWYLARYSSYTNGIVVVRANVNNRNLSIRLQDVTNNITLGSITILGPVTTSTTFNITVLPATDATIELQVIKSSAGGINPIILGCVMEFDI